MPLQLLHNFFFINIQLYVNELVDGGIAWLQSSLTWSTRVDIITEPVKQKLE